MTTTTTTTERVELTAEIWEAGKRCNRPEPGGGRHARTCGCVLDLLAIAMAPRLAELPRIQGFFEVCGYADETALHQRWKKPLIAVRFDPDLGADFSMASDGNQGSPLPLPRTIYAEVTITDG